MFSRRNVLKGLGVIAAGPVISPVQTMAGTPKNKTGSLSYCLNTSTISG